MAQNYFVVTCATNKIYTSLNIKLAAQQKKNKFKTTSKKLENLIN